MGNKASVNKPRSSKKGREIGDLSGMEITVDPCEVDLVSEMFQLPKNSEVDHNNSRSSNLDMSYHTEDAPKTLRNSSSSGPRKSTSSSRRSSDADILTCIIPGMDPLEMLKLVEECAEEDNREKELEESMRSQDQSRKSRSRRSGRRSRRVTSA